MQKESSILGLQLRRCHLFRGGEYNQALRRADFVEGRGKVWNNFIFFSDPDGNSWAVQEKPQET